MAEETFIPPAFEDCTLEQKQQFYFNAAYCPYCFKPTEYVDSDIVYQQSWGHIHICKNCEAWTGCLPNSDQAFGVIAKASLRKLREECHEFFEPLITSKCSAGVNRKQAQVLARKWMADFLGITIVEAHIAMLTASQCKKLIAECKKYYLTPEQIAERKAALDLRVGILKALCESLGIQVSEFTMNNVHQIEMKHPDFKKVLVYNVKKNTAWWQSIKPKILEVKDIYVFIVESFKIKNNESQTIH